MKKTLKAFFAFILIAISLMSTTAFAEKFEAIEPKFEVLVDDERFYSLQPIVVIDGRTYLPLRALGDCLGIYVEWDAALGQVEVSSTKEVSPVSYTEYPYEKFSDVPDFGKISGVKAYAEQKDTTSLGYTTIYGYQVPAEKSKKAIDDYLNELALCGYEVFFENKTSTSSATLYLKSATGRMINLYIEEKGVAVTVLETLHTAEDWITLDTVGKLPQKKFDAVTAGFKVMVDGEEFVSENPAMVINDRTYLPLRAMGDALGVFVDWDQENQTVIVNSNK